VLQSIETNVARASTKVSRSVVVRSAFATNAPLPSPARAQYRRIQMRGHTVWRNGK